MAVRLTGRMERARNYGFPSLDLLTTMEVTTIPDGNQPDRLYRKDGSELFEVSAHGLSVCGPAAGGGQNIPVRFEKRLPSCPAFPAWCRFDSVLLENIAHGLIGDVVANIGQGTLDPIVASTRVFLGKS